MPQQWWTLSRGDLDTTIAQLGFKDATDAYQREFIQHKLAEFDGNVAKAAESMTSSKNSGMTVPFC